MVKHAGPCCAWVSIRTEGGITTATVQDDGAGFTPDESMGLRTEEGGFGLFSIQERVEILGGTVEIDAAPGQGTRVSVSLATRPESSAERKSP